MARGTATRPLSAGNPAQAQVKDPLGYEAELSRHRMVFLHHKGCAASQEELLLEQN